MIILLSPSKRLDITKTSIVAKELPELVDLTLQLMSELKTFNPRKIEKLMSVNTALAQLNYERFQDFDPAFESDAVKPAILLFQGDVYAGLDAKTMTPKNLAFAQNHIRILTGLYGVLRPLDKTQPYRLEMGSSFKICKAKNLYTFWGDRITEVLNATLSNHRNKCIINLASNEYFNAVNTQNLDASIINITFKEYRNDQLKFISSFAKKARGLMARYIIDHEITTINGLKGFNTEGYNFDENGSDDTHLLFVR